MFSQKAGFCVVINIIFKKVVTSLLAFSALSKNKISEAARLITHLQDMSSITGTFEEFWLKTPEHLFAEQISVAAS